MHQISIFEWVTLKYFPLAYSFEGLKLWSYWWPDSAHVGQLIAKDKYFQVLKTITQTKPFESGIGTVPHWLLSYLFSCFSFALSMSFSVFSCSYILYSTYMEMCAFQSVLWFRHSTNTETLKVISMGNGTFQSSKHWSLRNTFYCKKLDFPNSFLYFLLFSFFKGFIGSIFYWERKEVMNTLRIRDHTINSIQSKRIKFIYLEVCVIFFFLILSLIGIKIP